MFVRKHFCKHWPLLLGSMLLLIFFHPASSQTDSLESYIEKEVENVVNQYYYTSFDSALLYLHPLEKLAADNDLWNQSLNIINNKIWVAMSFRHVDSIYKFFEQGNRLIAHPQASESISEPGEISFLDFVYTKGLQQFYLGDYQSAITEFYKIADSQNAHDTLLLFQTYMCLGQSYAALNDFNNSINHFNQAELYLPDDETDTPSRDGKQYQQAYLNLLKANSYYTFSKHHQLKDIELAKQHYLLTIDALEPLKEFQWAKDLLYTAYRSIISYYILAEEHQSALKINRRLESEVMITDADRMNHYRYLGETYRSVGQMQKALEFFNKSHKLSVRRWPKRSRNKVASLTSLADWYRDSSHWATALDHYQQAMMQLIEGFSPSDFQNNPSIDGIINEPELLAILLKKANTLREWHASNPKDQQPLFTAIATDQLSIALIDRMRTSFQLAESREFLAAKSLSIYEKALESVFQAYQLTGKSVYLEKGFELMEKNKSRLLLDEMSDVAAKQFAGISEQDLQEEKRLKSKLSYLKNELFQLSDSEGEAAKNLRNTIFETNKNYQKFVQDLEHGHPEYHKLKYTADVISIKQLQQKLPDSSGLIEYFYGDDNLYAIGITSQKAVFEKIAPYAQAKSKLTAYVAALSDYDLHQGIDPSTSQDLSLTAYSLYRLLMEPLTSQLKSPLKKIMIVPDGLLGYLPFGSLVSRPVANLSKIDFRSMDYLIKTYAFSYDYSASLRFFESPQAPTQNRYSYSGFAPSYTNGFLSENRGDLLGSSELRGGFTMLKNNQPEVTRISDFFGGLSFLGANASEAAFKQYASESKILHLSMHAFTNDENPMYSGLVFSDQDETAAAGNTSWLQGWFKRQPKVADLEDNDGILYAYELYNMELNAELALLSACETGAGELARGEGIMSLGRAFKYAGCPNVAMSLWKANDKTTAQIMESFSQYLIGGMQKDEALRQAKLSYLERSDKIKSHPFFWATFVMVGNNTPLSKTSKSLGDAAPMLMVGLMVLVLLIAFILIRIFLSRRKLS